MYPSRPRSTRSRRVAYALATLYVVAVALILGWPTTVDDQIPSADVQSGLAWVDAHGLYDEVEFTANIVMFIPAGVILATLLPWARWVHVTIGLAVSLAAEVGQALLRPERISDPHDVLANTMGTAFGVLAVVLFEQYRVDRRAAQELVAAPLLPTQRGVEGAADDMVSVRS